MKKHHLHPLNVLVIIAMGCTIMFWSIETFMNVTNLMEKAEGSALAGPGWDFAHIISGMIWVVAFSAGAVGCLVNLSNALRLRTYKVKDFSAMKKLNGDEIHKLNQWLDTNTYGPEHLKGLWGEEE